VSGIILIKRKTMEVKQGDTLTSASFFERNIQESFGMAEDYEKEENERYLMKETFFIIKEVLKKYLDLKKEYYALLSVWVMGTYHHRKFYTYPYLFFNAMKGSGKSRTLNLLSFLAKDGEMLNSLTEAVLFRTKGTLAIDEFEGVSRKGNESLKELLNSAYKKGTKVKRMKKAKTPEGEEFVVQEFDVFRPICMANIWGMEEVLGDRCIQLFLEKTTLSQVSNLIEIFEIDPQINKIKENLEKFSVVSSVSVVSKKETTLPFKAEKGSNLGFSESFLLSVVSLQNVYMDWNDYILNYITTQLHNYTKLHSNPKLLQLIKKKLSFFKLIKESGITGRYLELAFPLLILGWKMGEEELNEIMFSLNLIFEEKRQEEYIENKDVLVYDFVSQEIDTGFYISIQRITEKFREFSQTKEEWLNSRWMGRAIKRLSLAKKRKRISRGIEVILDVKKAQEKIKIFK